MSKKRAFDDALGELTRTPRPTRASLQGLSDLSQAQVGRLLAVWAGLPTERRLWVARTLGELAEDNFELDFTAAFKAMLGDPDAGVRRAAVEGLWESEDLAVAESLLAMLAGDPAAEVKAAAASALGHFALLAEMGALSAALAGRVRTGLLRVIYGEEPVEVRRRAVEAVGFLSGDEEVKRAIADAYAQAQPAMRTSAIFAMGRNCDPRWLPDLLRELESEDAEMRFEAARACGELEDERAVPRLLRLLVDPDLEVRLATIQSLGEIGGEQAVQALGYLMQSDDPTVAEAAEAALAEAEFAEAPLSFGIEEDLRRLGDEQRPRDQGHGHNGNGHGRPGSQ